MTSQIISDTDHKINHKKMRKKKKQKKTQQKQSIWRNSCFTVQSVDCSCERLQEADVTDNDTHLEHECFNTQADKAQVETMSNEVTRRWHTRGRVSSEATGRSVGLSK